MERPIFQPVGTAQEELDTPALVVDLAVMAGNIATLHQAFSGSGVAVRPHISCHQCPDVARRQVAGGGGIAVSSLGEAEVFAGAGFDDILIAGRVVTIPKIRRLCALAGSSQITLAVDSRRNLDDLSAAAAGSGVSLGIVVDLDAGYGYGGVAPGPDAVALAQAAAAAPGLEFRGLMAYEGPLPLTDRAAREAETRRRLQPVVDTRELVERAGLPVAIVSVGGTHNYDSAAALSGVTEVQAGVYPLMDASHCRVRPELAPAARILGTVISHPVAGRAVVDAGHKATGPDFGLPALDGVAGAAATRFSAEHGILELEEPAAAQLRPNDQVWLIPYDLALCVNQFDYLRAVSDGKLVGYWPIAARGRLD